MLVNWLKKSFSPNQLIVLALAITAGLLLRWLQLDLRPVHHDESLHSMYGRYFYDFPDIQYYKYDPMLHGPFIYNLMRLAYSTFSSTTWGARAFICLFGTGLLFAPLLFRSILSGTAVVALTTVIALSPSMVYWSRFVREDCMIMFWMMTTVWAACCAPKQWRGALVLLSFTLQACLKENIFVTLAILLGWIGYELILVKFGGGQTMAKTIWNHIKVYWLELCTGALASVFIFYYLFSEGFRYPSGPTDFFTKSFSYWLDQHNKERIRGVFNFHLYTISWYDSPVIVAMIYGWYRFMRTQRIAIKALSGYILLAALLCALYTAGSDIEHVAPWKYINLKDSLDVFFAVTIIGHSVLIPTWHLLRNERLLGFWSYLFLSHFFTYSYLGEKVPWLTVYPLITGFAYGAVLLSKYEQHFTSAVSTENILRWLGIALGVFALLVWMTEGSSGSEPMAVVKFSLALGFAFGVLSLLPVLGGPGFGTMRFGALLASLFCVWSLRSAILTNFTYAGHAREFMSQVHTTPDFHRFVKKIKDDIEVPVSGSKPTVCASGEMTWPITWYFVATPEYMFPTGTNQSQCDAATYRFVDREYADKNGTPTGYVRYDLPLRGWWVPDMNKLTPRSFLNYALNHTPWSETGFSWSAVYVKQPR